MAAAMCGKVGEMLPWDKIFDFQIGTSEVKAKLQAVKEMFRLKYVFACEQTFKMRYCDPSTLADDEGVASKTLAQRCYGKWRGFLQDQSFTDIIVDYANLPVVSTTPGNRRK